MMETPVLSPDPEGRGAGAKLQGRQDVPGSPHRRWESEGNISIGKVQLSHMEAPDSKEDGLVTEALHNMNNAPKKDGNFLIPTLRPPRRHPPNPYSSMVGVSSSFLVDRSKHLSGSRSGRLEEFSSDIGSPSVPSPTYCSKCKKMFATSEAYGCHEPMHLISGKLFPCIECGKYYRHNTALVIHRRTHTGEKPYSCSECGRCFNARSSLVTHMKIHSGEKLYSCSECGKGFAKTDDLFNHQLVHYRERKHTCGDCGKCFKMESELVAHRKNHPAEVLFLCSVCGKDYTQYSKLLRHEKTHPRLPPVFITSEKMLKDQEA